MSAVMPRSFADLSSTNNEHSVDELDAAIGRLAREMNADSYRMLVLVREFDDRFGWKKWSFKNCAERLAWRCGIGASAAREKVRVAHALRGLPAIAAAFADGRLSYSKVRAMTRVARRSLTMWRDEARGTLHVTVEVPIEEGEVVARALDCAVAAGVAALDVDPTVDGGKGAAWQAQQADALVAVARAYLDGGPSAGEAASTADRYQVVVHADAESLRGGAGCSDLPVETVKRLLCDGSLVTVVEDENGRPLDAGRKQRTVSTPLKRALRARDRGCTFPGCERRRYRREDFVDDDVANPSAEGWAAPSTGGQRHEVRERAAVYRLHTG